MNAPAAPTPVRCPRCRREVPGASALCPGCGAPLRLGDERTPSPLAVDLDLDRRGPGRGPAPEALPPAATDEGEPDAPFFEGEDPIDVLSASVADLEGPYWVHPPEGGGEAGPVSAARPPAARVSSSAAKPAAAPTVIPTATATANPTANSTPTATPTATATAIPSAIPPPPVRWSRPASPPAVATSRGPAPARGPAPTEKTPASPKPAKPAVAAATKPAERAPIVEVHVTRADTWRRVAAWLLDGGPFVAGAALLAEWLGHEIAGTAGPTDPAALAALVERERIVALSVAAVAALALAVYATLSHALAGATFGKRLLGLRVVGPDGRRPSPGRSTIRSAVAGVSLALLGLGFLVALFSRSGRALHDVISGTWVVKAP